MKELYILIKRENGTLYKENFISTENKLWALSQLDDYKVFKIEKIREITGCEVLIDYADEGGKSVSEYVPDAPHYLQGKDDE